MYRSPLVSVQTRHFRRLATSTLSSFEWGLGKDCIANATVRSAGGRGRGQAISPVVLESRGSPIQTSRKSIAAQTFRVPTTFAAIVFLWYWWVTCFYFIQFGIVIALVV